jgi:hypothetical protein
MNPASRDDFQNPHSGGDCRNEGAMDGVEPAVHGSGSRVRRGMTNSRIIRQRIFIRLVLIPDVYAAKEHPDYKDPSAGSKYCHLGRDCRDPEVMDDNILVAWIPAISAGMTQLLSHLYNQEESSFAIYGICLNLR